MAFSFGAHSTVLLLLHQTRTKEVALVAPAEEGSVLLHVPSLPCEQFWPVRPGEEEGGDQLHLHLVSLPGAQRPDKAAGPGQVKGRN